jgi:anti-sigma28 factor (negative regulator of flagellin synthesis)
MRVCDSNVAGAAAADAGRTQQSHRADGADGANSSSSGGPGDRIEFSTTLGNLSRAIAHQAADRTARVEALAAQYQSGKYRPDSRATSRGMITEALASDGR